MLLVAGSGMDHVAYILILFSLAFLVFLFTNMLITLYDRSTSTSTIKLGDGGVNGHAVPSSSRAGGAMNGHAATLRDAQEFELEGLMSDDDSDAENGAGKRERKGSQDAGRS